MGTVPSKKLETFPNSNPERDYEIQFEPTGQTFVTNRVGSTEKAKNEIGFEAKISLEQGLRSLIEWRRGETNK